MALLHEEHPDELSRSLRMYFTWQLGYRAVYELWVSQGTLPGLADDFDHYLVLVNLSDGQEGKPWWLFTELKTKKGSFSFQQWAGAFAHRP
jgi:hypothetical protein